MFTPQRSYGKKMYGGGAPQSFLQAISVPVYVRTEVNPRRKIECSMGVMVASWLIGKVVAVEWYNDRVMKVNIVIGDGR